MRLRGEFAALALFAVAGCASPSGVGVITVTGDTNLPAITQLRFTLAAGAAPKTVTFPETAGAPIVLPSTVSVTFPREAAGSLTANVDGLANGMVVAYGMGMAPLSSSMTVMVTVPLTAGAGPDGGMMDMAVGMPDFYGLDLTGVDLSQPDLTVPVDFSVAPPDLAGVDLLMTPSCLDGIKNQNESDVDCGGVCLACAPGKKCGADPDCLWGKCMAGTCGAAGFNLNRVWGAGENDIFAVGSVGTIVHWDGMKWSPMTSNSVKDFLGVSGTNGKEVWAVGGGDVLDHWDGMTWTVVPPPMGVCSTRYDVWGAAANDYHAGHCGGSFIRWNGNTWMSESVGGPQKNGIDGCAANDIWGVDEALGWPVHFDGMNWQLFTNAAPNVGRLGVACLKTNDVYMVGTKGDAIHYDGNAWNTERTDVNVTLREVAGGGALGVFAVGDQGTMVQRANGNWRTIPTGTSQALRGVWVSPKGIAWVVGDGGTLLRFDFPGSCIQDGFRDGGETDADCGGICAPCGPGKVCKVPSDCDSGVCVLGKCQMPTCGDGVRNQDESDVDCGGAVCTGCTPGKQCKMSSDCKDACVNNLCAVPKYNRVWGTSDSNVFAVGNGGTISRWDGVKWSRMAVASIAEFNGIHGSGANDVWAVGDNVLAHFDGNAWDASFKGPMNQCATRYDVWVSSPNNAQAPDCSGNFLKWNGAQWVTQNGGGSVKVSVDGCSSVDIWATDQSSGYPFHFDGANWMQGPITPNLPRHGVACVAANDAYLVGDKGNAMHWDGNAWVSEDVGGVKTALREIANGGASGMFVVGDMGVMLNRKANAWRQIPTGTMANLRGVWTNPATGTTFAGGDSATLLRMDFANNCKTNNMKDGVETDVDCGGYCAPCVPGKSCAVGPDCDSLVCAFQKCQAPTCLDGVRNQGETDVDCGIANCLCGAGKACKNNANCASGVCQMGQCLSNCQNSMRDLQETDVDCGGPMCQKCGGNKNCNGNLDCASGTCNAGKCTAVPVRFNILAQKDIVYQGINYLLLRVSFASNMSYTADWCEEYHQLCNNFGYFPTGCGQMFTVQVGGGYGICRTTYYSDGLSDTLGCNPSNGVAMAAQQNGYNDANSLNSFGFHSCSMGGSCSKTMCAGDNCNNALSYIDFNKQFGYTLCKK